MLTFDMSLAGRWIGEKEMERMAPAAQAALAALLAGEGPGSDFLGWVSWPDAYDRDEFDRILRTAETIRRNSDFLVVVGIGGSYLGARAAIDLLTHSQRASLPRERRDGPLVVYAGHNLSPAWHAELLDLLETGEVSVNVISKSGTTTEPAAAFRILKAYMERRYGREGARSRIFATTDAARGALRTLADAEGYETFRIPDDIGGRFSVLTAVGLLPIAAAGIDIGEILRGASDARAALADPDFGRNPALRYAAARNCLLRKGYGVEILANYDPALHSVTEWWKQLFGESEGKDGRGLFPAGVDFSTDLHSMGQYIQDGRRFLFETVLQVETSRRSLSIPDDPGSLDGLDFLAGRDLEEVNRKALQGTALAHVDGDVPNLAVRVPALTPYWFGWMVYFFEMACGVSGHLLGVNPFDQPGVEAYKRNMFALLGKPGFEREREALEARMAGEGN